MVLMESVSSGHKRISFRDKISDQREILAFDPYGKIMHISRTGPK